MVRQDDDDGTFRQSDVSRLERGVVAFPRCKHLLRLAAVLGMPLGEVLARAGWEGAEREFSPHAARPSNVA